jgi:hypothetical protein
MHEDEYELTPHEQAVIVAFQTSIGTLVVQEDVVLRSIKRERGLPENWVWTGRKFVKPADDAGQVIVA